MLFLLFLSMDTLHITIDEAVKIALENNTMIKLSEEDIKEAKYELIRSVTEILPKVEGKGYYSYISEVPVVQMFVMDSLVMKSPGVFVPVGHVDTLKFGSNDNYSFELSITQPLFTWGKIFNGIRISSTAYDMARLRDSLLILSTENLVKEVYLYTLVAKEFLTLTEAIEKDLKEHFRSAKERYSQGNITELQLLQAEASYFSQRGNVENARNEYEKVKENLKLLLGIPLDTEIVLDDSLSMELMEFDTTSNIEDRWDLKIMEKQKRLIDLQYQILLARYFPDIVGGFSYTYKYPFGFSDEWKGSWGVSIGVRWSIFNQGKILLDIEKNRAERRKMEFLIEDKIKNIKKERDELLREFIHSRNMIDIAMSNLKVAEKFYKTAKEQYGYGLATHLDFMDAEVNYVKERLSYIKAVSSYLIAGIKLEQSKYGNMEGEGGR